MEVEALELAAVELESRSPEATEALGALVGEQLAAGDLLALEGELGAGKTCFVRGLAAGLGVTEPVQSPTYTLMHTYEGRLPVYHLDAWMEGREKAFLADGGSDWLEHDGVAIVEWAARVATWLPLPRLAVALRHVEPEAGSTADTGVRKLRIALWGTPDAARWGAAQVQRAQRLGELLRGLPSAIARVEHLSPDPEKA